MVGGTVKVTDDDAVPVKVVDAMTVSVPDAMMVDDEKVEVAWKAVELWKVLVPVQVSLPAVEKPGVLMIVLVVVVVRMIPELATRLMYPTRLPLLPKYWRSVGTVVVPVPPRLFARGVFWFTMLP
jgi:hypothetical protein